MAGEAWWATVHGVAKSLGQRSPAGYNSWGCKELDTTERLPLSLHFNILKGESGSQRTKSLLKYPNFIF